MKKRENKKVDKTNLTEITGARLELEPYVGQILECPVFVTNSTGFLGDKRLLTEVRIPGTDFYIKHLWVKTSNLPIDKVHHGYQKIKLKVITYKDQYEGGDKYGVQIANKIKTKPSKMVIPKWKQEMIDDAKEMKVASKTPKASKVKSPFKKIRKVKA